MRIRVHVAVAALAALVWLPAHGESLSCSRGTATEGDSRVSVTYKCGEPLLKDSFCAPVFYGGNPRPVPEPFASAYVPCQKVDEWLYDRGPGNLMVTVRFRAGVVQAIEYGRTPH
jgi:hypothetical protein